MELVVILLVAFIAVAIDANQTKKHERRNK
jgi:hypothetical protein